MTLLAFMNLFEVFRAASWDGWRLVLARLVAGVREFYAIVGRGAGKSFVAAMVACNFASRSYRRVPGENIYVAVFAPDRKQSGVTFRYIVGLMKSVPALAALIMSEMKDSLELSNGVIIEVGTASTAAPRGRAYACVIIEEAAFLPTDESANPDVELLRAVRPGLARVPGSLLVVISSPYAQRGVLGAASAKYRDQPDGDVVFVQLPTLALNPTFDQRAIETAYLEDPSSASAEYGGEFRRDIEDFIRRAAVTACVIVGRAQLPYVVGVAYRGFVDFAGGSGGDSATAAIAHTERRDGQEVHVLDAVLEIRPPFSPEQACVDIAAFLKAYGVTVATSDHWGGLFPIEQMQRHDIHVEPCAKPKSEIYRELLPIINSGRVELLDHPRLIAQLAGLERRTARGGRDSIDHVPGGHDDVINCVAGVVVELHGNASVDGRGFLEFARQHVEGVKAEAGVTRQTHADCVSKGRISIDVFGKCKSCGDQVAEPQSGAEASDNPWIAAMNRLIFNREQMG